MHLDTTRDFHFSTNSNARFRLKGDHGRTLYQIPIIPSNLSFLRELPYTAKAKLAFYGAMGYKTETNQIIGDMMTHLKLQVRYLIFFYDIYRFCYWQWVHVVMTKCQFQKISFSLFSRHDLILNFENIVWIFYWYLSGFVPPDIENFLEEFVTSTGHHVRPPQLPCTHSLYTRQR